MAVFALLCGVLVIAFPVSIFSELWSEELQKIHELKNDDEDDDDMSYQSDNSQEAPVKFVSTANTDKFVNNPTGRSNERESASFARRMQQTFDDLSQNSSESDSLAHTGHTDHSGIDKENLDHVPLEPGELTAKDIADLRRYMESIETTQEKIRKILVKLEQT